MVEAVTPNDARLVDQARNGDRDAFAEIVRRYQTLVCSVAYGSTGSFNTSEELAHEAFIAAWTSFDSLRESDKLRSWLCGIVRNLAKNRNRKRGRDVLASAATISSEDHSVADADDPAASTIAREEAELLNRSLSALPENYRTPLVLYYREQQSVGKVAELLDLSPSAVKQRLSRGREMLRQEVAEVVERGLRHSAPATAFTLGVLAALPVMSSTAKAATLTATTAKGITAAKAAGFSGAMGMILGPLAGFAGSWFGYQMSMKTARSEEERAFVRKAAKILLVSIVAWGTCLTGLLLAVTWTDVGRTWSTSNPGVFALGLLAICGIYVMGLVGSIMWINRSIANIREQTNTQEFSRATDLPPVWQQFQLTRKFDSKTRFLGLPLVSLRFGGADRNLAKQAAYGWVAISDGIAYGPLFASGTIAVGGISFGAIGIGGLSIGGLALGAIALGGAAIGGWASGGIGVGWCSFSGVAVAYHLAIGGVALAKHYALGGITMGLHANDENAKSVLESSQFFHYTKWLMTPWGWWLLVAGGMIPVLLAIKFIPPDEEQSATP